MAEIIRSRERTAIGNCCAAYKLFKELDYAIQKETIISIESSILDASVDKAKYQNIPTYWDSKEFVEQYSNTGYHVKINLDINSSVNRRDEGTKYYFINLVYKAAIVNYLRRLYDKQPNASMLLRMPKLVYDKILRYISSTNIKTIGYMTSLEMNPNINQIYIDELNVRGQQMVKIKYSEMHVCYQCGNKKTQTREKQTRSLDEESTLFITCVICGNRWTQY